MTDLDVHLPDMAAGDEEAFVAWLAGGERRVRLSLRSFAAHVDTEALLQETLLRVWQVAPRVQPDGRPDALLRLAIRTDRNLAVSELRRARLRPVDIDELERAVGAVEEVPPPDRARGRLHDDETDRQLAQTRDNQTQTTRSHRDSRGRTTDRWRTRS